MIQISKIKFEKNELAEINKVLSSGRVVQGEYVEEFERKFADYIGVKYAVAVSSGTGALYLGNLSLEIGPGDEVITTPFSFIASANSILYTGAKPVFVDINPITFNMDPTKIREKINKKTKAILPVHLFGLSCQIDEILKIAKNNNLFVIEDACQAHGAEFNGRKVGSFGDIGCFSFYATKNMTTIEGGIITTNNYKTYMKLKLLRNHGSKVRYHHDILGFNLRMSDVSAVIGIQGLKKLNMRNFIRNKNANYLNKMLYNNKKIILPIYDLKLNHVYHQYSILTKKIKDRNIYINELRKSNIMSEIYYPIPIHKQKYYLNLGYKSSFPIAEDISRRIFSIPIHPYLKRKELDKIISVSNSI